MKRLGLRGLVFLVGIVAFAASICTLIISVIRARHIQGYIEQADAAVPWVQVGILTALLTVLLSPFGRGKARIASVLCSCALLLYWVFIGVTLY